MRPLLDERVRGGTNPLKVVVAPLVALLDRWARIAPRVALGLRSREGEVRAEQRDDRRRIAHAFGAEVPAGRRRQREPRLSGTRMPAQLVAVRIDLRDEERQRREAALDRVAGSFDDPRIADTRNGVGN